MLGEGRSLKGRFHDNYDLLVFTFSQHPLEHLFYLNSIWICLLSHQNMLIMWRCRIFALWDISDRYGNTRYPEGYQ
jgi:hypothetical protein